MDIDRHLASRVLRSIPQGDTDAPAVDDAPIMPKSYYSTEALKETLVQLVDFDRINSAKGIRLSVGAVNVRTGRFAYFDSAETAIRPEHVMASGSLPPGFPPVEIDGELLGRRSRLQHAATIRARLLSTSQPTCCFRSMFSRAVASCRQISRK